MQVISFSPNPHPGVRLDGVDLHQVLFQGNGIRHRFVILVSTVHDPSEKEPKSKGRSLEDQQGMGAFGTVFDLAYIYIIGYRICMICIYIIFLYTYHIHQCDAIP